MNQQGNTPMAKKVTLAASMMLLFTISGQALAYSNVSPKPAHAAVSDPHASHAFDVFGQMKRPRLTQSSSDRYQGGPKSND
jgi:hypothetical protein